MYANAAGSAYRPSDDNLSITLQILFTDMQYDKVTCNYAKHAFKCLQSVSARLDDLPVHCDLCTLSHTSGLPTNTDAHAAGASVVDKDRSHIG